MARESHLLSRLRPQLDALDEAALIALASVGLLRRARKELESLEPTHVDTPASLDVQFGAQRIRFDARGPAHATCTCPAKTTCQHVLGAWLYLQTLPSEAPPPDERTLTPAPAPFEELLALNVADLIAFAGLPAVRDAIDSVRQGDNPVIAAGPPLVIRLAQPPLELRYAGGGLDAFVLDYRGRRRGRYIVQAVLALQQAAGKSLPDLPQRRSDVERQAREARVPADLLDRVLATLREALDVGIVHLSENMVERMASQSVAAAGRGLHRLALGLERLATHLDLQLGRSARTSTTEFLDELASVYALASAIRKTAAPSLALRGEARAGYEPIARLELVGVAVEPWWTASGYSGLTLLAWSPHQRRWYSATESRPTGALQFDPVSRYRAPGPWDGLASPAAGCATTMTLADAAVSRAGRLSLTERTRATAVPLQRWPAFEGCEYDDWAALLNTRADDLTCAGLAERDPHADYFVLRPAAWSAAEYDSATQHAIRVVRDKNGAELPLTLRYSRLTKHGVERLEGLRPPAKARVLVRVTRAASTPVLAPIAMLVDEGAGARTDNLLLDPAPAGSLLDPLIQKLRALASAAASDETTESTVLSNLPPGTERRLHALERELLEIAERGCGRGLGPDDKLVRLIQSVNATGLQLPGVPARAADLPAYLLRTRHLTRVVRSLQ